MIDFQTEIIKVHQQEGTYACYSDRDMAIRNTGRIRALCLVIDRDSISVYFVFVTFKLYSLFIYSSAELSFFATLYLKN